DLALVLPRTHRASFAFFFPAPRRLSVREPQRLRGPARARGADRGRGHPRSTPGLDGGHRRPPPVAVARLLPAAARHSPSDLAVALVDRRRRGRRADVDLRARHGTAAATVPPLPLAGRVLRPPRLRLSLAHRQSVPRLPREARVVPVRPRAAGTRAA